MTLVGKSSDSGEALCATIFGGFILVVLCFDIFQSAWEKRVKAKIIDLAEIRKQEIEEQQRFYNSPEWKDLRRHVLRERPHVCELCGRRIYRENDVTVDHIKPRSKFPELDLDKSNLQVLCRRCNSSKGATYDESSMKLEATPEIPTGSSERA
jgi:5-methylcytosine-specific restriction endonuclease McrA